MMKFNADLYRIATAFESDEQTRYYLIGVFVEPCPAGGVTLTATDGHRLICIRDEYGEADQSGIVQLTPDAMKLCKSKPREQRRVTIDGLNATIEKSGDSGESWEMVAMSAKCFVDGTFPDWRRVVPADVSVQPTKTPHSWYRGKYLASFATAAIELEKVSDNGRHGELSVCAADCNSPALVFFSNSPHAFGVFMPVRGDVRATPPAWFFGKTEEEQAA